MLEYFSIRKELAVLTEVFVKVRYSNKAINEEDVNKCIIAYNEMKIKLVENLGLGEKLLLKLNMFSFLKKMVHKINVNIKN